VAAGSVFLFFVPFQIPKRRRQRSREINSIRLEKAKLPHHGKIVPTHSAFRNRNRFGMSLAKPLEPLESLSRCLGPWAIRWPITFSRNLSRIFTHYLSEQPEMSSHHEASKKAKTVEES